MPRAHIALLYPFLAPERITPAAPGRLQRLYSEHPHYGGAFDTIVPHLTVVQAGESEQGAAQRDLGACLLPGGGVPSRCEELVLIADSSGRWQTLRVFALGSAAATGPGGRS